MRTDNFLYSFRVYIYLNMLMLHILLKYLRHNLNRMIVIYSTRQNYKTFLTHPTIHDINFKQI